MLKIFEIVYESEGETKEIEVTQLSLTLRLKDLQKEGKIIKNIKEKPIIRKK